jgi:hypothetical protein
MLPSAGQLRVTLTRRGGGLDVAIAAPSPLPVAEVLIGRPAGEVARLAPLIWNICAAAQGAAVRSALGLTVDADAEAKVRAETLREHVVKLCMVWPTVMGEAAGREALALTARALTDPEAAASLAAAIVRPLDQVPGDWDALAAWMEAGETAPARAFAAVRRGFDPSWGRADLPLFDPAEPFVWERATQGGQAVENGPACRLGAAPLLASVEAEVGRGMLWRMAARLVEVDTLLRGGGPAVLAAPGIANAARGAMLVEAEAGQGGVTAFRRLSPTDFALAEGGVLATALATLPAEPSAPLRAAAQMVIETVDPCIATELDVREDAHA